MSLQDFANGYLECAFWASLNWDDMVGGFPQPMDRDYGPDDLAPETRTKMEAECAAFYAANEPLWADAIGYSDARAGHDFWLTRNGHGAGFWDRKEIWETRHALTKAAKAFRECNLIAGDDGKVYQE